MNRYKFMLSKQGDKSIFERKNPVGFIFEPKFGGTRVFIYKEGSNIELINRKGKEMIFKYPEFLDLPININAESCVLDAELVVPDCNNKPSHWLLQERELAEKRDIIEAKSKINPAVLFIFDILEKDGKVLVDKFLRERKMELKKAIIENYNVRICPWTANGRELLQKIETENIEGIMAKEMNSKYEQGVRSWSWLKINNFNTINAIVIGIIKKQAKRSFDELIIASYNHLGNLVCLGKLSEGFNDKILTFFKKKINGLITAEPLLNEAEIIKIQEPQNPKKIMWLKPELVVKIKYSKLEANNTLVEPSFLRLRFDKTPESCVLDSI
ncbi:MAG: ATP-dependent DNA ligase [Candidatus Pacearchaeota archaeon]|nr:ATP-dependent DNA ligase [Candidatus Pacearchaeota archaeon]